MIKNVKLKMLLTNTIFKGISALNQSYLKISQLFCSTVIWGFAIMWCIFMNTWYRMDIATNIRLFEVRMKNM